MKRTTLEKRSLGLLFCLSLLAIATPGFAENRAGAVTVSPYVGGYIFDHEQTYQNLETSPIYGIRAGYNFTENWGAEARFGYINADSRLPNGPEANVLTYGVDALYHFNVTPEFVPFINRQVSVSKGPWTLDLAPWTSWPHGPHGPLHDSEFIRLYLLG